MGGEQKESEREGENEVSQRERGISRGRKEAEKNSHSPREAVIQALQGSSSKDQRRACLPPSIPPPPGRLPSGEKR